MEEKVKEYLEENDLVTDYFVDDDWEVFRITEDVDHVKIWITDMHFIVATISNDDSF